MFFNFFLSVYSQTDFPKAEYKSKGCSTQDEFWEETFEAEEVYKTRAKLELFKEHYLQLQLKSEKVFNKIATLITDNASLLKPNDQTQKSVKIRGLSQTEKIKNCKKSPEKEQKISENEKLKNDSKRNHENADSISAEILRDIGSACTLYVKLLRTVPPALSCDLFYTI